MNEFYVVLMVLYGFIVMAASMAEAINYTTNPAIITPGDLYDRTNLNRLGSVVAYILMVIFSPLVRLFVIGKFLFIILFLKTEKRDE